jgi:uncharacterized protein with FMN-binding domain
MDPINNQKGQNTYPSNNSLNLLNKVLIMSVLVLLLGFIAVGVVYSKKENKEPDVKEVKSRDTSENLVGSDDSNKESNVSSVSASSSKAPSSVNTVNQVKPTVTKSEYRDDYRHDDEAEYEYEDDEYEEEDDYRVYKPTVTNTYVAPKTSPTPTPTPTPVTTQNQNTQTTSYKYKNGTYNVTISYWAPSGSEDMGVSITISNDLITDTSINNLASDKTSRNYISKFSQSYSSYVIGQNIANLSLNRVVGASLTTAGFNDALDSIRSQAKI